MSHQASRTMDDDAASLFERVTERFRDEVLALLSAWRAHLDDNDLPRIGDATEEQLLASREAHRIAVRLKDLVARALSLHDWSTGELTTRHVFSPPNRLQFRQYCLDGADLSHQSLPAPMCDLSADSAQLYARACALEDMLLDLHDIRESAPAAADDKDEAA